MRKSLIPVLVLLIVSLVGMVQAQDTQPSVDVTPSPTEDYSFVFYTPTPVPAESWNSMQPIPFGPELPSLLNHDIAIYAGLIEGFDLHAHERRPISGSALQNTPQHPRSFSRIDDLLPLTTMVCQNGDNVAVAVNREGKWAWGGIDSLRPDVKRLVEGAYAGVLTSPELVAPDLSAITGVFHNTICVVNASTQPLTMVSTFPSSGAVKHFVRPWGLSFTPDAVSHLVFKNVYDIIYPGKDTEFFNEQHQMDVATNVPNCTLTLEEIAAATGVNASMDVMTIRQTMAQFHGLECGLVNVTVVKWDGIEYTNLYFGVYVRYLNPSWVDLSFMLDPAYDMATSGVPIIPTMTATATATVAP